MRKPNKRELILAFVLVGAVAYTASLDAGIKKKRRLNAKYSRAASPKTLPLPASSPVPADRRPRPRRRQAAVFGDWGLDPFNRLFARPSGETDGGGPASEPELRLVGVMYTQSGAAAMIGRTVVTAGERIGDYVVESVGNRSVTLVSALDGSRKSLELE